MLTVNTQLLKPFCWRRTSLSLCRLTEVELQFNVQLSSPGKTRSVRSADYTPAQTLPGCCSMSGRDGEGLHHCLKWSSVWVFFFFLSPQICTEIKTQTNRFSSILPAPPSFWGFTARRRLSVLSFSSSFLSSHSSLSPSRPSLPSSRLSLECYSITLPPLTGCVPCIGNLAGDRSSSYFNSLCLGHSVYLCHAPSPTNLICYLLCLRCGRLSGLSETSG